MTAPASTNQPSDRPVRPPMTSLIIGAAIIVISFLVLMNINRNNTYFPLWSAIAFLIMTVTPFYIMGVKAPERYKALILLVTGLIMLPILGIKDSFYLELATQIGIFAAMALGLNIVVGFAGLLDLGYIAFFAVGAYLWGVFTSDADILTKAYNMQAAPSLFYLFLFIGVIMAGIFGILLGLPVLRLKGDYLAIVTLGFGEVIRVLVSNLSNISNDPKVKLNLTNGAQGLFGIKDPPIPDFFVNMVDGLARAMNMPPQNARALAYQFFFFFLVIVIMIIFVILTNRLDNSPIGRAWTAIREDETAAIAMGVPLVRMKLMAFATGASFAGAMGVIYAAKQTFVSPESFSFNQSIFILAIVIVGGMGSIRGVLLGAAVVTLLNLHVLKNFSLLVNNLRNNNTILTMPLAALFVAAIVGVFVFVVWRWLRNGNPTTRKVVTGVVALFGLLLVFNVVQAGDFHFQAWPVQLDPARYERLVFGLLLVMMMIFRPAGILPASRRLRELQGREEVEEA